jgi:hypothetical protein
LSDKHFPIKSFASACNISLPMTCLYTHLSLSHTHTNTRAHTRTHHIISVEKTLSAKLWNYTCSITRVLRGRGTGANEYNDCRRHIYIRILIYIYHSVVIPCHHPVKRAFEFDGVPWNGFFFCFVFYCLHFRPRHDTVYTIIAVASIERCE